jgi:ATPase complex subunit ATP10
MRYEPRFRPLSRQFASSAIVRAAPKDERAVKKGPSKETKEEKEEEFVPRPLGKPIGFREPPQAGQNTGREKKQKVTGRTFRERQMAKTQVLADEWGKNYFQDFKNIRKYRSGKVFMANPKIFKAEAALYFPNFHGYSLAASVADTTPALEGKVSVVNVYSSAWGEAQANSFTGPQNTELKEVLNQNKNVCQKIDVNIEENDLKAWILALFHWSLRRQRNKEDWGKYFIVRRGVSDLIRETLGMLNRRVGYVFLVDQDLKIRWAGSGDAEGTERDDMNKGLRRLVQDAKSKDNGDGKRKTVTPAQRVNKELEAQAVNAGVS